MCDEDQWMPREFFMPLIGSTRRPRGRRRTRRFFEDDFQ
jgi:hypothetical protein